MEFREQETLNGILLFYVIVRKEKISMADLRYCIKKY